MVLLPPNITTEDWEVGVTLHKAEGVAKMDQFGIADPFIEVTFANITLKTNVKKGRTPEWNQELIIPVQTPSMSNLIRVELFDW